jgi:hypothetical protein
MWSCENGKMRPAETIPGRRRIKVNGEGGEIN